MEEASPVPWPVAVWLSPRVGDALKDILARILPFEEQLRHEAVRLKVDIDSTSRAALARSLDCVAAELILEHFRPLLHRLGRLHARVQKRRQRRENRQSRKGKRAHKKGKKGKKKKKKGKKNKGKDRDHEEDEEGEDEDEDVRSMDSEDMAAETALEEEVLAREEAQLVLTLDAWADEMVARLRLRPSSLAPLGDTPLASAQDQWARNLRGNTSAATPHAHSRRSPSPARSSSASRVGPGRTYDPTSPVMVLEQVSRHAAQLGPDAEAALAELLEDTRYRRRRPHGNDDGDDDDGDDGDDAEAEAEGDARKDEIEARLRAMLESWPSMDSTTNNTNTNDDDDDDDDDAHHDHHAAHDGIANTTTTHAPLVAGEWRDRASLDAHKRLSSSSQRAYAELTHSTNNSNGNNSNGDEELERLAMLRLQAEDVVTRTHKLMALVDNPPAAAWGHYAATSPARHSDSDASASSSGGGARRHFHHKTAHANHHHHHQHHQHQQQQHHQYGASRGWDGEEDDELALGHGTHDNDEYDDDDDDAPSPPPQQKRHAREHSSEYAGSPRTPVHTMA